MADQRVLIVGAGVLGLFTAYELVGAGGVDVTVIDAAHPGNGSSGRSVGMVETQYLLRPDVEVRVFGRAAYARLEEQHGLGFVHGGYLRLGRTDEDVVAFEESVQAQREFGVHDSSILSADEIARRWPQMVTSDVSAGLFGVWDGYVDGYEVCQLLTDLVKRGGGRVMSRSRLLGAEQGPTGTWRLDTSRGVFEAEVVVNAAGGWAAVVGEQLGAPVQLLPQLHGAAMIELGGPRALTPFVMDYVPGSGVDGVYFRSERADQLVAGLHTDEAISAAVSPDVPLGALSLEYLERLTILLAARLKGVDDMSIGRSWSGIYPMTPDHRPVAGPHSDTDGVVCALGAGGSGIQLAPAVGRVAADAVLGREDTFWAAADWRHGRQTRA